MQHRPQTAGRCCFSISLTARIAIFQKRKSEFLARYQNADLTNNDMSDDYSKRHYTVAIRLQENEFSDLFTTKSKQLDMVFPELWNR